MTGSVSGSVVDGVWGAPTGGHHDIASGFVLDIDLELVQRI